MQNPSFLAIGPPRTGTSWLYTMLKQHPEINFAPDKGIRYFWERFMLGKGGLLKNLFDPHWHFQHKRNYLKGRIIGYLKGRHWTLGDITWDLRYFLLPHNDKWYLSLFEQTGLWGDIDQKYCELPGEEVIKVKALLPDIRIMIGLRDPIERSWSRARMNLLKGPRSKPFEMIEDEMFYQNFEEEHILKCNDYKALVERWQQHFGAENIWLYYYDELIADPHKVLREACSFLGVSPMDYTGLAEQRINKGPEQQIPEKHLRRLVSLNIGFLERMADYFDKPYPRLWFEKYKQMIDAELA